MPKKLGAHGATRLNFYLDAETVNDMNWLASLMNAGDMGGTKRLKPNKSRLLRALVKAEARRAVMRGGKVVRSAER